MRPGDRYIAVATPIGVSADNMAITWFDRVLQAGGWRQLFRESGLALAVPTNSRLRVRRLRNGRGVVLGDLFAKHAGAPAPGDWLSFVDPGPGSDGVLRALTRQYWGRYVVLHEERPGRLPVLFRDPSGALDVLSWRCGEGCVVASDLLQDLPDDLGAFPTIDWAVVPVLLADFGAVGARSAFVGILGPAPGAMLDLASGASRQVWRPADFTTSRRQAPGDYAKALRGTTDHVIGSLAEAAAGILAEISGGLDSAIVTSALAPAARDRVVQWVNFHTGDREGDERAFARAVAERFGLALSEASKTELRLTQAHLDFIGRGVRPSAIGLDFEYDQDNADRCGTLGADTLFTGQGGDGLFLQTRSPLLAIDAMRQGLRGGELWAMRHKVAQGARTSIWRLAAMGWRDRLIGGADRRRVKPFLSQSRGAAVLHPWLEDLQAVPPAKRLHIHALAGTQIFHGHSRRARAADVIHPLTAQPLVELCLAIPAFDLAAGENDRPLARAAFVDRLPERVVKRRSKGDMSGYYGRMLARSLDVVRPYLLEGQLAGRGLLDTSWLDQALTVESLAVSEETPDLLELLALESWARAWSPPRPRTSS